jgi:signal transduction histidine kinase
MLIVVLNSLLGLLVFMRNPRSRINLLFLLIVAFICLWTLSNYFTDHSSQNLRLILDRLSFAFPVLVSGILALLSRIFPVHLGYSKKIISYIGLITLFGVYISLSSFVVKSITITPDGTTNSLPGVLYNFYSVLVVVLLFGCAVWNYYISRRKADSIQKLQSSYMATGFLVSFLWALVVSVLLPIYLPKWNTAELGPDGTIIFISATAYAIVRHKLFDIRLVVARSVAYLLTLSSIVILCIVPAILVTTYLLHNSLATGSITSLIIITFVAVVIFQPLKKRFDKISSRLFFRDFYEPQEVIDELGNLLVGISNVNSIIDGSRIILKSSMKPAFVHYVLKNREVTEADKAQYKEAIDKLYNVRSEVLVTDNLEQKKNDNLHKYLRDNNIAMVARLRTSKENIGFILLGYKQSGNIYNSIDERLIGIAADEIAISLLNAFRFEEIQKFNLTLQERVNEATKQLRRSNEKLKELDDTKDDFISMASHQLRTPLTIIKGYISMLNDGDAGKISVKQRDFLDQAMLSTENMVRLVADLLNVSRITSGKFSVDYAPVNLATITEEEVKKLSKMAEAKNIELTYLKPNTFPLLMLDESKTRQVVGNFIDNAIYYARDNDAKINVELTLGDSIELKVVDNGIGVANKDKNHLFTKFYRAKNAKTARPDGTGIGLYLAKVVIDEQGGELIFESTEGVGSTFGFRFGSDKIIKNI